MNAHYKLIDPDVLLNAAGNDAQGFHELLAMFLRIVPGMAGELRQAVSERRHEAIAHQAHSLKSCLSLVGATTCSAQLEKLERAARGQAGDCGARFELLNTQLGAVIAEAQDCYAASAQRNNG
jgi:HPt (histidine-containing phosphotransfer) domain-containing protein